MIGIESVGVYIPQKKISNYNSKSKFAITDEFIKEKIGVDCIAVKDYNEDTSTLCIKAYQDLLQNININPSDIDVVIVVTQNPDYNIPQVSAMLHGYFNFREDCASFDISLGCSGFVYGLSVITSFMEVNGFKKGLLFTSDPYSKIVDRNDKNTSLLFGDASTVSLISDNPIYSPISFTYGTMGKMYKDLICVENTLHMNGRSIANFVLKDVPKDILKVLNKSQIKIEDIDKFLFHQGSGFIINSLIKKLNIKEEKVMNDIKYYGNTVSSSIPILLKKIIDDTSLNYILMSGFGVGLSISSAVLKRVR